MKKIFTSVIVVFLSLSPQTYSQQSAEDPDLNLNLSAECETVTKELEAFKVSSAETIQNLNREFREYKSSAEKEKNDYIKEIERLKKEKDDLTKVISKNLPTTVVYKDHSIRHNNATFHLNSNRPCILVVSLKRGTSLIEEKKFDYVGNDIYYTTPTLAANTKYNIEVDVLDLEGNKVENLHLDKSNFPALEFTTKEEPSFQITSLNVDSNNNNINVEVNASNGYLVQVKCYERISDNSPNYSLTDKKGNTLSTNYLNAYTEKLATGTTKFSFTSLKYNKEYKIEVTVINDLGISVTREFTHRTSENEFGFQGPLKMNFSTLNSVIEWRANGLPDRAEVKIINPSNSREYYVKTITSVDNSFSVTLNYDEIQSIWKNKSDKTAPVIEVVMYDKYGQIREMSSQVGFTIPTEADVEAAEAQQLITSEEKESILKVIKGHERGKKFKWEDLIQTGLPLLLTIL